jgi:uncharacterized protein (DUF2235 family)
MKTIVVCFDVDRDFGLLDRRTNVFKIYVALAREEEQLPLYIPIPAPETGKGHSEAILKVLESLVKLEPVGVIFSLISLFADSPEINAIKRYFFGNGIARQIQVACEVLLDQWKPDDRIAVFGNSYSAGVALLFAEFVHEFGLVPGERKEILPELIERFFDQTITGRKPPGALFRNSFSRPCQVSFIGIWDCPCDMSWIGRGPALLRPESVLRQGAEVRHALSIDERRRFFTPLILSHVASQSPDSRVKEVWFAGVHSDVMGSYPERESGLSQVALAWMMNESAACGIRFEQERRRRILGRTEIGTELKGWPSFEPPDPLGPIHDSFRFMWWQMELYPQRLPNKRWRIPLGRRREIPSDALIHRSVCDRISALHYSPENLPAHFEIDG